MIPFIKIFTIFAKTFSKPMIQYLKKMPTLKAKGRTRRGFVWLGQHLHILEAKINRKFLNIETEVREIKHISEEAAFDYAFNFILEVVILYGLVLGIAFSEVRKNMEEKKRAKEEMKDLKNDVAVLQEQLVTQTSQFQALQNTFLEHQNRQAVILQAFEELKALNQQQEKRSIEKDEKVFQLLSSHDNEISSLRRSVNLHPQTKKLNVMTEKRARKRLHVSNIPYELKKTDLIDLFSNMGPVLDCELINDKTTGKFKGSAKIEFPDYYSVKAALRNLNRYEIKGRFLKLNFANSDKFPSDKSEIINEDDISDPEEFESKNAEKDISEVLSGLQNSQKAFLLQELKQMCEINEEELRNILSKDEKLAEAILQIQRDLKLDRSQQNQIRNMFENEAFINQDPYNRQIKSGGGMGQAPVMINNKAPFNNRMHPINKNPNVGRKPPMGRDNMNKMVYNNTGMPISRMGQNYMPYDDQGMNMNMGGMQPIRGPGPGPDGQPFYQNNEFDNSRQFNPNMGQPGNMNKNKIYYNTNNRMFN